MGHHELRRLHPRIILEVRPCLPSETDENFIKLHPANGSAALNDDSKNLTPEEARKLS